MMVCPWATVTKMGGTVASACCRLTVVSWGWKLTRRKSRNRVPTIELAVGSRRRLAALVVAVA